MDSDRRAKERREGHARRLKEEREWTRIGERRRGEGEERRTCSEAEGGESMDSDRRAMERRRREEKDMLGD